MKNQKNLFAYYLLSFLGITGMLSLILVPKIEPIVQPYILKYADNTFAWLIFVIVRIFTVVFFQIKLGVIAVLYHRALGFSKAFILSTIIFLVGGSINYYLGKKYQDNIIATMELITPGFQTKKTLKNIQKFLTKSKTRTTLMFLSFSYMPLSYLLGMKKIKYFEFLKYLLVGGMFATVLMLAKDCLIGINNYLSLFLQFLPVINIVLFTTFFTIKDSLNKTKPI